MIRLSTLLDGLARVEACLDPLGIRTNFVDLMADINAVRKASARRFRADVTQSGYNSPMRPVGERSGMDTIKHINGKGAGIGRRFLA